MKIIFLDIDGVLNSTRSSLAFGNASLYGKGGLSHSTDSTYPPIEFTTDYFRLDPVSVSLLRRAVEDTGAKIVISSTWRIKSCLEHFHQMFDCYGWDTRDIVIDFAPEVKEIGAIRGHEVQKWLENNAHRAIRKYVILDDHTDFFPWQSPHFVKTNEHVGLSHVTYNSIIDTLGIVLA